MIVANEQGIAKRLQRVVLHLASGAGKQRCQRGVELRSADKAHGSNEGLVNKLRRADEFDQRRNPSRAD